MVFSKEKSILLRGLNAVSYGIKRGPVENWFVIEPTGTGIGAKQVFDNLPADTSFTNDHYVLNRPGCVLIGSLLYVLGGRYNRGIYHNKPSDIVRRLDIKNPRDGWKACKPLPHPCSEAQVCAGGNHIYIFPEIHGYDYFPDKRFQGIGFIYDVSDQKPYPLVPPPGTLDRWHPSYCFHHKFGGGCEGILFPERGWQRANLNFFCSFHKQWQFLSHIYCRSEDSNAVKYYASSNGILYVTYLNRVVSPNEVERGSREWEYDGPVEFILRAYDIQTGNALLGVGGKGIRFPHFKKLIRFDEVGMGVDYMKFVAVDDYKLCYLWAEPSYRFHGLTTVFKGTVVVSPDSQSVSVSEEEFDLFDLGEIDAAIPFDGCGDENEQV